MVELAEKVRFLNDPAAYAGATHVVEAKETHMSWVFLTDRRVYKLKKPLRRPFLDFTSIDSRRHFCEEELRLNRRLAPSTYLSVVPLRKKSSGGLCLGGSGDVVDWLVEMERLPQHDMLDARIEARGVAPGDVSRIASLLTGFYAALPPQLADGGAAIEHFVVEHAVTRAILEHEDIGLGDRTRRVLDRVEAGIVSLRPALERRIAEGRIVEGHGDLRPEHVCLTHPPQVIDCLEFSRALRMVDPYDEVNHLGLECDVLGAGWIRPMLLEALETRLGGRPEPRLMALYGGFRMLLRARLCLAHLLDVPVRKPGKWRPLAMSYIAVAERETVSLENPAGR
ncbi:MAG: hypothetical protein F9K19_20665 [Rhizobiaceae bacterium]|nr:MAG: hypothetical protein F9K19_20665 [Rhizobiaceae bacterium]